MKIINYHSEFGYQLTDYPTYLSTRQIRHKRPTVCLWHDGAFHWLHVEPNKKFPQKNRTKVA